MDKKMDILFTADSNYVKYISVVLKSLAVNDSNYNCCVHLIHDDLNAEQEENFRKMCSNYGYTGHTYRINDQLLQQAPVNKHYSSAMYYRLLAVEILPETLKKVIYLDPDLLIINPLHPLWEMPMEEYAFLAASHTEDHEVIDNLNRVRLNTDTPYYNTGVLVMDLEKARNLIQKQDIYAYIEKNENIMFLPDQDIFNALYGNVTKAIPDEIWNYDARKYPQYYVSSKGLFDEKWIIQNTAILHFCGKHKPWNSEQHSWFHYIYWHYMQLTERNEP